MMDKDQATKIAAAVNALRPDWDTAGIVTALGKARDRAEAWQVAVAAIAAAAEPANRTPAVIALAGNHWQHATAHSSPIVGARTARCTVYGHEHEPAHACRACRSEQLAAVRTPPPLPADYTDHGRLAGRDD